MSKAQLRKELANLDREQLVQVVLDVYNTCPDAKEYLEFFINPDVKKLQEKVMNGIVR